LSPSETNWNVAGTIATLKVPIASLAPNASIKKTILLRANNVSTYQGQTLVNRAEISSPAASNNALGLNDKDSTPDAILGNDKGGQFGGGSEEHTSELQSHHDLVCRLLLEKKNK